MKDEEARKEIIAGIQADAGSQADAIIAEGKKAAEQRVEAADKQAERMKREAAEKDAKQTAAIEREAVTRLAVAKRRMRLEMMEKTYQDIISRCKGELDKLIGSPAYEKILEDWITEAAVGLRAESAQVNCSSRERDTVAAILPKVEARVKSESGLKVSLVLSNNPPLPGQGVVVISADGRTAFNNQVSSRLFRLQSEIRKLVHNRLF